MPTQQVERLDTDWNAMAEEWLALWDAMAHSNMWNKIWMHLFSRVAKHDTKDAVKWADHMPRLFMHILWAFPVPIGKDPGQLPFGKATS